jgi:hypothetical protein
MPDAGNQVRLADAGRTEGQPQFLQSAIVTFQPLDVGQQQRSNVGSVELGAPVTAKAAA